MLLKAITSLLLSSVAIHGLIHGVDNSVLVSEATYTKAFGEGFTKAVIRGYQESCSTGGSVDPNFISNYNNARAAGYSDIDTYFFPCTGTNNHCKSFANQVAEFGNTLNQNHLNIGRIWIDIETDNVCQGWNYGPSGNLQQAQALVSAFRDAGYNIGIYSSAGKWGSIFGSQSVVLDSSLPLWFSQYDNVSSLILKAPFGGWTTAEGKQYTDQSASGQFNLNIFA